MTSLFIDTKIKGDINYFGYDEFSNVEKVGEFGKINRANWKNGGIKIALKTFASNEDNIYKFLKELNNLKKISFHPNINKFYGITKDPALNYMMVLQYANQGNLREFLKNDFDSLHWKDKSQMALDITLGLKFLHSKNIIHGNLHAKNILVHNKKLMISGLGLLSLSSSSRDHGMLAYVEPQCFKVNDYIRDKKSDIYSLGVLLWEITSGYPPLSKIPDQNTLDYKISNGCREQPISYTPPAYVNLYQRCWDDEPNLRPAIDNVFNILEKFTLQFNTDDISNKVIEKELENFDMLDDIKELEQQIRNEWHFNALDEFKDIEKELMQLSKKAWNFDTLDEIKDDDKESRHEIQNDWCFVIKDEVLAYQNKLRDDDDFFFNPLAFNPLAFLVIFYIIFVCFIDWRRDL